MPDFNMQQNFPIASVINAYQKKGELDNQTTLKSAELLNQSLDTIGKVGQSLYARKQAMAQALAGAQMYAQTPEGQQLLAPTVTSTTSPSPVKMWQTAAYDPASGSVTPNTGLDQVSSVPKTETTSTPSPISMHTLATAFMGESPSNMLTQMFDRQKQRQQMALDTRKEAFTEQMKPIELAQQADLTRALTGVKGREVTTTEQNNIRNQITALEAKKAQAIKDFPELTGTFISGILPEGSNAKEAAAVSDYKATQAQIENYNRQLYGGGGGSSKPRVGISMTTPSGISYTVTP